MHDPYRDVAQSLLTSVNAHSPHYRTMTHSQSVNLVSDDLIAGHRPGGRMSTVRRFFCLFVTFDLLFTSLMWLICVMMRGETLRQIFEREIINYDVKSSLIDIVLVAVIRFIFLLLFYAVLHINNWSIIALSTSFTCAFLIGKVFLFDWPDASTPVYHVFLILASFVIAWLEAWFLDFRVLPQELEAKRIIDSIVNRNTYPSERTPLLPPPGSTRGESTVNWFSPVDSPENSPHPRTGAQTILTQEQIDEYTRRAEDTLSSCWELLHITTWKEEKRGSQGDVVETTHTKRYGKVYRFTGIVDCPAQFLFHEFRDNIGRLPEWNPTILRSELIKEIGPGIDLSYQVTAGGGAGMITPRDFVILRRAAPLTRSGRVHCEDSGEPAHCYISTGASVEVPNYPPVKDMVRGHNKIGCWFLTPKTVKTTSGKIEQRTVFQWLMCCDLKGKIPQFVLDRAFSTVMLDNIKHVRKFVADSRSKGLF